MAKKPSKPRSNGAKYPPSDAFGDLLAELKKAGETLVASGANPQAPMAHLLPTPEQALAVFNVPPDAVAELTDYQKFRIRELAAEKARRRVETLKLYEPLPPQLALHKSFANEKLAIGANRGTKTTACAAESAMALMGCHPWLSGIEGGYPLSNGRAAIVGYDEAHLGGTIFPKLFLSGPGSIKIIRDLHTGLWRTYRPWTDEDKPRWREWRFAPPLIPKRFIKGKISWRKMGMSIPEKVKLINGWEINFYSSKAQPVQGVPFNFVWFDEEIKRHSPSWYHEVVLRLVDEGGRFLWSATPHLAGDDLIQLHDRAELEKEKAIANPAIEEFFFSLVDNPHMSDKAKKEAYDKLANNPEELHTRYYGGYARLGVLVYPEFNKKVHTCPESILPKDDRHPPKEWARFVALDPGRRCAAIFAAVPPPAWLAERKLPKFVVLYDEMFVSPCDTKKFGQQFEYKTRHQNFELVLIDRHGGQVHDSGSGLELQQQYAQELRELGVWDRFRRRSFVTAECDREEGIETFRQWLLLGKHATPYVYVCTERMPRFLEEIGIWGFKKTEGKDVRKPEERNRDIMDCCRYMAMHEPSYRTPQPLEGPVSPLQGYLDSKLKRQRGGQPEGVLFGPQTNHSRSPSYN